MIVIGDTVISDDLIEAEFVCNIAKCKGACCEEGDLGAPLETHELAQIDSVYESVKPFLSKEGIAEIERQGKYLLDHEGDYSTPTVGGRQCAYAVKSKEGHWQCGIENAHKQGKSSFKKPISCHLYPVRVKKHGHYEAVNYDRWHICKSACTLGEALKTPVFVFLKEALVRHFGEEWYQELEKHAAMPKTSGPNP